MQSRMTHPVKLLPDAMKALAALGRAAQGDAVPGVTHTLVHLRASQINGCGMCVDMHSRELRDAGQGDERIWGVAAWRESTQFDDAERAALELTEYVTRLADRPEPVPDDVWERAAKHYDETGLAQLLVSIASINVWNRLNAAIKQPAGAAW